MVWKTQNEEGEIPNLASGLQKTGWSWATRWGVSKWREDDAESRGSLHLKFCFQTFGNVIFYFHGMKYKKKLLQQQNVEPPPANMGATVKCSC